MIRCSFTCEICYFNDLKPCPFISSFFYDPNKSDSSPVSLCFYSKLVTAVSHLLSYSTVVEWCKAAFICETVSKTVLVCK